VPRLGLPLEHPSPLVMNRIKPWHPSGQLNVLHQEITLVCFILVRWELIFLFICLFVYLFLFIYWGCLLLVRIVNMEQCLTLFYRVLWIGMEYLRTNHLVLAQHFLSAANDSCNGTDALAKSELGVLNLYQRKYDHAIWWFLQALGSNAEDLIESRRHHPKCMLDLDSLCFLLEGVKDEYWVRLKTPRNSGKQIIQSIVRMVEGSLP
jgi:hypothetical protein